jgi:hypothetical protein
MHLLVHKAKEKAAREEEERQARLDGALVDDVDPDAKKKVPPPAPPPPSYYSDTPRPSPCTNRTRRVPHPVLIGHAASITLY